MSIEDYKRHLDARALQSPGKLSPSRNLLEQLIDIVTIYLFPEATTSALTL